MREPIGQRQALVLRIIMRPRRTTTRRNIPGRVRFGAWEMRKERLVAERLFDMVHP
jgi:hypothetical protein